MRARAAGPGQATWNGRDTTGSRVSTGVYFIRMTVANRTFQQRRLLEGQSTQNIHSIAAIIERADQKDREKEPAAVQKTAD